MGARFFARVMLSSLWSFLLLASCSQPLDPTCEPICAGGLCEPGSWVGLCAATFTMGMSHGTGERPTPGEDTHEVTLTRPFEIMTTEVTQAMFVDLLGFNPSVFVEDSECSWCEPCADDCPADSLTWPLAAALCNALSEREGYEPCYLCDGEGDSLACERDERFATPYDCPGYRMPTEAEWEYAARAGTRTHTYNGDIRNYDSECSPYEHTVDPIAWFCGNSTTGRFWSPQPVAQKLPNQWGLFDVLGNVEELTEDAACHQPIVGTPDCEPNFPIGTEPTTDPWHSSGPTFVTRGGCFFSDLRELRSAYRGEASTVGSNTSIGLRPVRTLETLDDY